jgi:hypothetical protein
MVSNQISKYRIDASMSAGVMSMQISVILVEW